MCCELTNLNCSGLIHLHSLGGSTFVFCYYSLGNDTAMPGGLYAGICHAFLVIYFISYLTCGPVQRIVGILNQLRIADLEVFNFNFY